MKVVLANAVYFKGNWLAPFEKRETRDERFTTGDGRSIRVPMMHRGGRLGFRHERGYQVVRLPYRTGMTAMYVVLPDAGVPNATARADANLATESG